MVPEAPLERTEHGLVASGAGWFVLNARDARWSARPGRRSVSFTGKTEWEADTLFPMLGVNLAVLEPGEPNSLYHWETEAEAFLVVSGEALLIVEGQERPLRQWDFVHCPPKTEHVIVGAGDGPCVVIAVSSRQNQAFGPHGEYVANEVAHRHRASPRETTQDDSADWEAAFPSSEFASYRDGWLPLG
ncbi:MAG TPA: cupin domain-containing protein [Gaiellaceae bacterium]|nr:cupin domain-containing protein [Gaiellaceae bacterium]